MTSRRGPKVNRQRYEGLDQAVEALHAEAESALAEGPLTELKMIRTFEPSKRVAARLEISTGGMLGGRTAGIDVMGDGRLVAFRGGVVRRELEPEGAESAFDAVRRALE